MEPGFYTFADMMPSPLTGETISPAQRLRSLVEEIELADQVGLDVFGVGEHWCNASSQYPACHRVVRNQGCPGREA